MAETVAAPNTLASSSPASPWLTAAEAAGRARVGRKTIYRETRAGRLRAARIGGRREYRYLAEWIDSWLAGSTEPVEINRGLRVSR